MTWMWSAPCHVSKSFTTAGKVNSMEDSLRPFTLPNSSRKPHNIWFRVKSADTETRNILLCRGAWSTPSHFIAIKESDVRSLPLEGKPWTAVWDRCQRTRNKRLASVPALLQSLMELSGVRQVLSSCLVDESTCPNFYCPPTPQQ